MAEADEHTIRIWWTGQLTDVENGLPQILLGEMYGQPTHVKAVILAGEAPSAEFDDLRAKILTAVPALAGQFKDCLEVQSMWELSVRLASLDNLNCIQRSWDLRYVIFTYRTLTSTQSAIVERLSCFQISPAGRYRCVKDRM